MSPDYYTEDYQAELQSYAQVVDWERLNGTTVLVTGATGLIGSYLIDLILARNAAEGSHISVVATGRSMSSLRQRFAGQKGSNELTLHEIAPGSDHPRGVSFDYIVHCASNAQPVALSQDPVGTLVGTIEGTNALLKIAASADDCRLVFLSSSEVYGSPTPQRPPLREDELGPLDILAPRSSYPEAKRAAETLCAGYVSQYGVWAVVARPAYVYGPTATPGDTRVIPQFVDSARREGVIRIASDGSLRRAYCYVGDCATGLLRLMTSGRSGEAYNISDAASVASIREVAEGVGRIVHAPVEFVDPRHASATPVGLHQGILDTARLEALGWSPRTGLELGLTRTIAMRGRWA
ncbi:MAG: UDP-glucuronate decarboxylase [Frankiaceae bacterium]|nr:UDP-glucuronate decarboxylase [Frankiaceae bacterium]